MKKIIALLLVATLVLSFAACGKKDSAEETTNNSTTTTQAAANEQETEQAANLFFDVSQYNIKNGDSNDDKIKLTTYTLKNDISYDLPSEVTVGGHKIVLNTTKVSDLLDDGCTVQDLYKDHVLKSKNGTGVASETANGEEFTAWAINRTDNELKAIDCIIERVSIDYKLANMRNVKAPDFVYSENITSSITLEELVKKLGNPNHTSILEYYDENGEWLYNTITVYYWNDTTNVSLTFKVDSEK